MKPLSLALLLAAAGCATSAPEHRETVARAEALMRKAPGRPGDLALRCDPPDAQVELDGVPQGSCQDYDGRIQRLPLGNGMRRVEVKKDGYWSYQSYHQAGGAKAVLAVSLAPKAPAQGSAR